MHWTILAIGTDQHIMRCCASVKGCRRHATAQHVTPAMQSASLALLRTATQHAMLSLSDILVAASNLQSAPATASTSIQLAAADVKALLLLVDQHCATGRCQLGSRLHALHG